MKENLHYHEYVDRLHDYADGNPINLNPNRHRPARSASWHQRRRRELQSYGEWLEQQKAERENKTK